MRLVFPNINYKEKAIDYIKEFYQYNSEINGTGSLDRHLKESEKDRFVLRSQELIQELSSSILR